MCEKNDKWSELDNAARANLNEQEQKYFFRYKEQLKKQGHKWENDAEDILFGYIWNAIDKAERFLLA